MDPLRWASPEVMKQRPMLAKKQLFTRLTAHFVEQFAVFEHTTRNLLSNSFDSCSRQAEGKIEACIAPGSIITSDVWAS